MSDERVSTERVRAIAGETHEDFLVKVCRDLLDARTGLENRTAERDAARQVVTQYKQELVNQEQRIKELERERDEVREALGLILPLAKGYAAAHPVGSNQTYIEIAARAAKEER